MLVSKCEHPKQFIKCTIFTGFRRQGAGFTKIDVDYSLDIVDSQTSDSQTSEIRPLHKAL